MNKIALFKTIGVIVGVGCWLLITPLFYPVGYVDAFIGNLLLSIFMSMVGYVLCGFAYLIQHLYKYFEKKERSK